VARLLPSGEHCAFAAWLALSLSLSIPWCVSFVAPRARSSCQHPPSPLPPPPSLSPNAPNTLHALPPRALTRTNTLTHTHTHTQTRTNTQTNVRMREQAKLARVEKAGLGRLGALLRGPSARDAIAGRRLAQAAAAAAWEAAHASRVEEALGDGSAPVRLVWDGAVGETGVHQEGACSRSCASLKEHLRALFPLSRPSVISVSSFPLPFPLFSYVIRPGSPAAHGGDTAVVASVEPTLPCHAAARAPGCACAAGDAWITAGDTWITAGVAAGDAAWDAP